MHFEIKTAKAEIADLTAVIGKETADSEALGAKIEELVASVVEDEEELKKATAIRKKEGVDFAVEDKDLTGTISAIERASESLAREVTDGASLVQLQNAQSLAQALEIMVGASALDAADAGRLQSLLQAGANRDDEAVDAGAPDAAVYEVS